MAEPTTGALLVMADRRLFDSLARAAAARARGLQDDVVDALARAQAATDALAAGTPFRALAQQRLDAAASALKDWPAERGKWPGVPHKTKGLTRLRDGDPARPLRAAWYAAMEYLHDVAWVAKSDRERSRQYKRRKLQAAQAEQSSLTSGARASPSSPPCPFTHSPRGFSPHRARSFAFAAHSLRRAPRIARAARRAHRCTDAQCGRHPRRCHRPRDVAKLARRRRLPCAPPARAAVSSVARAQHLRTRADYHTASGGRVASCRR